MGKADRKKERKQRHQRIRRQITGTQERPRLSLFKSHKHMFVQVIDDTAGHTVASVSSQEKELKSAGSANMTLAKKVGAMVAQRATAKGVKKVVFDRGGFRYHGAVKALADAARESGLEF